MEASVIMKRSSGVLFRKAINGYNRNDVNEYLENMSLKAKKRENELDERICELEKELNDTNTRLEAAEARDFADEAAVYEKKLAELEKKLDECEKLNDAKSEYAEKLATELRAKDEELALIKTELDDARRTLADTDKLAQKAAQYDSLGNRLGEIMLNAGNTAEKIVTDAGTKAAQLISEASQKRDNCLEVLRRYTKIYCDKLSEVTVASAQERLDRIHSEMAEFEASISRSVINAQKKDGSVNEYMSEIRRSLDSSLDSILNGSCTSQSDFENKSDANADKLLESAVSDILSQIDRELDDSEHRPL